MCIQRSLQTRKAKTDGSKMQRIPLAWVMGISHSRLVRTWLRNWLEDQSHKAMQESRGSSWGWPAGTLPSSRPQQSCTSQHSPRAPSSSSRPRACRRHHGLAQANRGPSTWLWHCHAGPKTQSTQPTGGWGYPATPRGLMSCTGTLKKLLAPKLLAKGFQKVISIYLHC